MGTLSRRCHFDDDRQSISSSFRNSHRNTKQTQKKKKLSPKKISYKDKTNKYIKLCTSNHKENQTTSWLVPESSKVEK